MIVLSQQFSRSRAIAMRKPTNKMVVEIRIGFPAPIFLLKRQTSPATWNRMKISKLIYAVSRAR